MIATGADLGDTPPARCRGRAISRSYRPDIPCGCHAAAIAPTIAPMPYVLCTNCKVPGYVTRAQLRQGEPCPSCAATLDAQRSVLQRQPPNVHPFGRRGPTLRSLAGEASALMMQTVHEEAG